jgi:hypothetical protein
MRQMERIEFIKRLKEILEMMFPKGWFLQTKNKDHPAYVRWRVCNKIIEQGGMIRYPEQEDALLPIARTILDSGVVVALTDGDFGQLKFESFNSLGEKDVREKIRSRILNPQQFEDLMVELCVGAYHKMEGHKISLLEKEGYPDLKVEIAGICTPLFIECKHLWTMSSNNIQSAIKKANRQIKKAKGDYPGLSYGVTLLDASIPLFIRKVENDLLPRQLEQVLSAIELALSGNKNTSISAGIIVWDDYMKMGDPPKPTYLAFRRRAKIVRHKAEILPIPDSIQLFQGFTIEYWLNWQQCLR